MSDLKVTEVAKIFRVSRQSVVSWIHDGLFPNAYKLRRDYRIPVTDVEALKKHRPAEAS